MPVLISTALIVLVTGLIGVTYLSSKGTAESKSSELEGAKAELALLPSVADINAKDAPRRTLKTEHDARVTALSSALTRRVSWDRILREISLVLPNDVWLRNMSATSPTPASGTSPAVTPPGLPPTLMTIEGSTYSHDAVARLITRLSVIPDLKNVWLTKSELGVDCRPPDRQLHDPRRRAAVRSDVVKVTKRKLSPVATAGVGVGITLVIALFGWFVLVSPQRSRATAIDAELVLVEQQISESRAAQMQSSGAEPIRSADLFRLTKAMPSDNDIAGVMLELSRVAAETGIVFEAIKPQATTAAGANRAQLIDLIFTGNFYSLSDFLYRLRNLVTVQKGRLLANGRLFAVEKLAFAESPSGFPSIRAFLTVSAFLYGSGPVAGAAPPAALAPPSTDTTSTDTTTGEVPPVTPEAVGP